MITLPLLYLSLPFYPAPPPPPFALFPSFSLIEILFAPACGKWVTEASGSKSPTGKLYSSALFRFIPTTLRLTVEAPLLYVRVWVCLVLAASLWTAYVLLHCLRPHLVNDDIDVMSLSSLSSPVCLHLLPLTSPGGKVIRWQLRRRKKDALSSIRWLVGCVMSLQAPWLRWLGVKAVV